jgi:hypothetical protein
LEELDQLDQSDDNSDDEGDVELIDEDDPFFDESSKTDVVDLKNLGGEKMRFNASNHWRQGL